MDIPMKYEDVVAKLASVNDELGRLKRVRSAFINRVLGERDAAEGREAALREELLELSRKLDVFYSRSHGIKNLSAIEEANDKAESLQQRLTVAEQLLRETSDYLDGSTRNAVWCDSILHKKMRAALKPAAEGEGS